MIFSRGIAYFLCAVYLSSCAVSSDSFYKDQSATSSTAICRAWLSSGDPNFKSDLAKELNRRGYSEYTCASTVQSQNNQIAVGVTLGAIITAVAVEAARKGGNGGAVANNAYCPMNNSADLDWDWDQFYNASSQLVWQCRGVQTGEFASGCHCAGKIQSDWRWPGK